MKAKKIGTLNSFTFNLILYARIMPVTIIKIKEIPQTISQIHYHIPAHPPQIPQQSHYFTVTKLRFNNSGLCLVKIF